MACLQFRAKILVAPFFLSVSGLGYAQGFVEDSKAALTLRNYYFDRDFSGTTPKMQQENGLKGVY